MCTPYYSIKFSISKSVQVTPSLLFVMCTTCSYKHIKINKVFIGCWLDSLTSIFISFLFVSPTKNVSCQVDKAIRTFDKCAPPAAKNAVLKGQLIVKKACQITQDLVKEAQVSGPLAAISYAGTMSKHFAVGQLAVVWYKVNRYPALHGVSETAVATAAHWSEKYNKLVIDLAAKGNNLFNYVPLVPVDEIARAYKQVEAAANKKLDASSSSESDSDKE